MVAQDPYGVKTDKKKHEEYCARVTQAGVLARSEQHRDAVAKMAYYWENLGVSLVPIAPPTAPDPKGPTGGFTSRNPAGAYDVADLAEWSDDGINLALLAGPAHPTDEAKGKGANWVHVYLVDCDSVTEHEAALTLWRTLYPGSDPRLTTLSPGAVAKIDGVCVRYR